MAVAAEGGVTDVDVPEEGAAGRVVGPDLLLVAERRRRLLGRDHRGLPGSRTCGSPGCCRLDVVGAETATASAPRNGLWPGNGEVRLANTAANRWPTRNARSRPASGRGSAGSPSDTSPFWKYPGACRSPPPGACMAVAVAHHAQAVPGSQALIGRLGPGSATSHEKTPAPARRERARVVPCRRCTPPCQSDVARPPDARVVRVGSAGSFRLFCGDR